MAEAVAAVGRPAGASNAVLWLRVAILGVTFAVWEAVAASGLLYRDVVPSLVRIGEALFKLLASPAFYFNLSATAGEVAGAVVIGSAAGLAVGVILGSSRFLSRAFEPFVYYLGPSPKIIFFPVMIMWFGVGPASKVALGAVSCFFPMALSTAAGMRQIDRVLIRVGRSFRASTWQMVSKIYLPAMRIPVLNGFRLGMGLAIIGVLLSETKLSNRGIGFMINHAYSLFDMPSMYSLLILVFLVAMAINAGLGRFGRVPGTAG